MIEITDTMVMISVFIAIIAYIILVTVISMSIRSELETTNYLLSQIKRLLEEKK